MKTEEHETKWGCEAEQEGNTDRSKRTKDLKGMPLRRTDDMEEIDRTALDGLAEAIVQAMRNVTPPSPPTSGAVARHHHDRLKKACMPTFSSGDAEAAEKWLEELELQYELQETPLEAKAKVAKYFFVGDAAHWFKCLGEEESGSWTTLRQKFKDRFIPKFFTLQKMEEFENIQQRVSESVIDYHTRFQSLSRFYPGIQQNEDLKVLKFRLGLLTRIRTRVSLVVTSQLAILLGAALSVEHELQESDVGSSKRSRTGETKTRGRLESNKANPRPNAPICKHCGKIQFCECRRALGACFACGQIGHLVKDCPGTNMRGITTAKTGLKPTLARVFNMTQKDARGDANAVTDDQEEVDPQSD